MAQRCKPIFVADEMWPGSTAQRGQVVQTSPESMVHLSWPVSARARHRSSASQAQDQLGWCAAAKLPLHSSSSPQASQLLLPAVCLACHPQSDLPKWSRSGNTSAWRGRLAPPESTKYMQGRPHCWATSWRRRCFCSTERVPGQVLSWETQSRCRADQTAGYPLETQCLHSPDQHTSCCMPPPTLLPASRTPPAYCDAQVMTPRPAAGVPPGPLSIAGAQPHQLPGPP